MPLDPSTRRGRGQRYAISLRRLTPSRLAADDGAVLVLVGIMLTVLLAIAGVAVDLTALDRRAQTLQNGADAAALGGVGVWVDTGDSAVAETRIRTLLDQNGLGDVDATITFESASTLTVDLVDNDPPVFLASIFGIGGDIARDSTARLASCESGCSNTITIPPPVQVALAQGTGDGFLPLPYDGRLYSVTHVNSKIQCIDRATSQTCWPERELFGDGSTTPVTPGGFIHEGSERLYFVGSDYYDTHVGCWELADEQTCSYNAELSGEGEGYLVGIKNKIYVFTGAGKVHCWKAWSFARCAEHPAGRDTALTYDPAASNPSMFYARHIVNGKKIYMATANGSRVHLSCWDARNAEPCSGFGVHELHANVSGSNSSNSGRLLIYRNSLGKPRGVCSVGVGDVECFHLSNGSRQSSNESSLMQTVGLIPSAQYGFWGNNTYLPSANRVFILGEHYGATTYCHDFTTGYCGQLRTDNTPFGSTLTYGYVPEGDCLIGLGHNAIFFSVTADLQLGCASSFSAVRLATCNCAGVETWPEVHAENLEDVEEFLVVVTNVEGTELLPDDGSEGIVLAAGESLDLTSIPIDVGEISFKIVVRPKDGEDPWADGVHPQLVIGASSESPVLAE